MVGVRTVLGRLGKVVWGGTVQYNTVHTSTLQYSTVHRSQYSTLKRERESQSIGVWGACYAGGQPHLGTGQAPGLIRETGLINNLQTLGCNVIDHGNIESEIHGKEGVFAFNKEVAHTVTRILSQDQIVVTLGGDHSVGLGTVAGHLEHDPEAVVVWVDAHADINTLVSSGSGNMHGMPVSFNIPSLNTGEPEWLVPRLRPGRLAYLGLRDVDGKEREMLEDLGIAAYYTQDIDRLGVEGAVREALYRVDPQGTRNIHMSFDIDVLDPCEAPATGTTVRGGLTLREGQHIGDILYSTGRLRGMDLVEVNPRLGKDQEEVERTVRAACNIILAALGHRRNCSM